MWNVEDRFEQATLDALPAKGFRVSATGGVLRAEKYGCGAEFRRAPGGRYQMTILPSVLYQGGFTQLWDAGYQKFLITEDRRKVPAVAQQLTNLRQFNEELRYALGVPTYYNEALGSTCQVSTYDRVQGRPGAVPADSVGIKPDHEH